MIYSIAIIEYPPDSRHERRRKRIKQRTTLASLQTSNERMDAKMLAGIGANPSPRRIRKRVLHLRPDTPTVCEFHNGLSQEGSPEPRVQVAVGRSERRRDTMVRVASRRLASIRRPAMSIVLAFLAILSWRCEQIIWRSPEYQFSAMHFQGWNPQPIG